MEILNRSSLYLVTGAAGFVGGFMTKLLLAQGLRVRAMVRNPAQSEELEKIGAEVVIADMKDIESLKLAVTGVEGIFHIAGLFRQAGLPESEFHAVNAVGTKNLFEVAIDAGVSRIIHCSTVGVIEPRQDIPSTEDDPYSPADMYQRSKMDGEKIALEFYRGGKMSGVVIRPAMIYGPGDERTLKIFKMISRGKFFYVGKGDKLVHWIDVRDLAHAFLLGMQHDELNAEIYIISGRTSIPLREMANLIADKLDVSRPWLHLPVKPMQWLGSLCEVICGFFKINPPIYRRRVDFYTKNRNFDGSKAKTQLGFEPSQNFSQEIDDIIESYKSAGTI
jgi:nucleoside-diphosphate-sugar epimerase